MRPPTETRKASSGAAFGVIFRTLRYRNFRLFFTGQLISLVGTWMQQIAMGWLVYRLTGSAFLLGLVSFSVQIPAFVLSPFTGVLADRWDRRRTLFVTQSISMLQAFVMAALTLAGIVNVKHIIALGVLLGCVNALDIPVRQAFIMEMVEAKDNLSNAIALNSLMFNAARLVGPSIAGIMVAATGEGVCFLINGISFIAVIASLWAMRIKRAPAARADGEVFEGVREGFRYAFSSMPIRTILLLLSIASMVGTSYVVIMPVFAKDVLKGGPGVFGFLVASAGIGALAATLYLASRRSALGLVRKIPVFSIIFSAGLIALSQSRWLWLSLSFLALAGFGFMAATASMNIILQTIVDDDKRGRVMSLYAMAFMGMAPIGSLVTGFMVSRIGVSYTLIAGGAVCILASLVFWAKLPALRKAIHPIYRKIGIIKEVASGIGEVVSP